MNARLPALLCAVSVVGSLAAGCGGSGEATPPPPPPHKSTAAIPPPVVRPAPVAQAPVTHARAIAFARAVNLTAADLAEAHARSLSAHVSSQSEDAQPERELERCGFVRQRAVASASSPGLKRGSALETEEIGSSVTVYASEAAAQRELAALKTSSGRACAARLLRQRLVGKNVGCGCARISKVDLAALPVAGPPARSSVGIRIAVWVQTPNIEASVPGYVDLFAFSKGPAVVSYGVISLVQPEPATVEQQLGARLTSRAGAVSL